MHNTSMHASFASTCSFASAPRVLCAEVGLPMLNSLTTFLSADWDRSTVQTHTSCRASRASPTTSCPLLGLTPRPSVWQQRWNVCAGLAAA
jgi:hypothetical protein